MPLCSRRLAAWKEGAGRRRVPYVAADACLDDAKDHNKGCQKDSIQAVAACDPFGNPNNMDAHMPPLLEYCQSATRSPQRRAAASAQLRANANADTRTPRLAKEDMNNNVQPQHTMAGTGQHRPRYALAS